jgi:hypothetical protein
MRLLLSGSRSTRRGSTARSAACLRRACLPFFAACLLALALAEPVSRPGHATATAASETLALDYAERAQRTRKFTLERLAWPARAADCERSVLIGLRREVGSILSDAWYDASQVLAEAALLTAGVTRDGCVLEKSAAFLRRLERGGTGGYYPRADVDGRFPTTRDLYVDDNALIGMALLEARRHARSEAARALLLEGARSAGRFLLESGLWDETFGGGFWWNTNRGRMAEGKPTQATALAAQLFLQLYDATGEQRYVDWATHSLAWLDRRLFDQRRGLYLFTLRHWDMPAQQGEYLDPRSFNYDQGIMIEVHLLYHRLVDASGARLVRAQELARATRAQLWDHARSAYRLSTEDSSIYTAYSAWMVQSLLALHAVDHDAGWLDDARHNLDGLESNALDPSGGYYLMQVRCERPEVPGCDVGPAWTHDPTKVLFSQAWMQRAQALLAGRLAGRS